MEYLERLIPLRKRETKKIREKKHLKEKIQPMWFFSMLNSTFHPLN